MFGKGKKKLDRKMRRRIRKTSAVMLLISAITVAAIPVPEAAAADGISAYAAIDEPPANPLVNSVVSGTGAGFIIPEVADTDNIYASEDSRFTFAYMQSNEYGRMAVLLNCEAGPHMTDLVIPETVNAYIQYTTTDGSSRAFAAANQDGEVLYYKMLRVVTAVRSLSGSKDDPIPGDNAGWGQWASVSVNFELEDKNINYPSPGASVSFNEASGQWEQTVRYLDYYFVPCRQGEEGTWNKDSVQRYLYDDTVDYPHTDIAVQIGRASCRERV